MPSQAPVDLVDLAAGESVYCGDRLRWGTRLAAATELALPLPAARGSELALAFCVPGRGDVGPITVGFDDSQGRRLDREEVATSPGWNRAQLRIPDGAQRVVLRGVGRELLLDEVLVSAPSARRTVPRERGIIVVSVDTLRADALEPYGGPATPAFARLAADSERYQRHYAATNWTKPSHASMLTGQPPEVHGATSDTATIHPGLTTLAERFAAAGWVTGGLVRHVWLGEKFGFAKGFGDWRVVDWDAGEEVREAARWLEANADRPFFFFLHLMTAHSDFHHLPYEGPGVDRSYVAERWGLEQYGCRLRMCASTLLEAVALGRVDPLPEDPEVLRTLYAAGVREVDEELGVLLEALERSGILERATLVVTADHGEELLGHGATLHTSWWEPVVTVPLFVRRPEGPRGTVVPGPSASIDLAPTLVSEAGLDSSGLPGQLLGRRRADQPVFVSTDWHVVVQGTDKLVLPASGAALLFDLEADRGETVDLAAERPGRVAELSELRVAWLRSLARPSGATGDVPLTEEEAAELRALGYLGQ